MTAVRQSHLVSLSRPDLADVLASFDGEDSTKVLKEISEQHAATVQSLAPSRKDSAKPKGVAAAAAAEGDADAAAGDGGGAAPSSPPGAGGGNGAGAAAAEAGPELTMSELRERVSKMEAKLAAAVEDMKAARACAETLPQLVALVQGGALQKPATIAEH